MGCAEHSRLTELEFVLNLNVARNLAECGGQLVECGFAAGCGSAIEDALLGLPQTHLVWAGLLPPAEHGGELHFRLCVLHWLDLARAINRYAYRTGDTDWTDAAVILIRQVVDAAGLDHKEIANLMQWQRVRLT